MTYCLVGGTLLWAVYLCYMDYRYRRLPNKATVPAAILSIVLALLYHPFALWGALLWWLLYIFIPVGGGDRKLALSLGIILCHKTGILGVCWGIGGAALGTLLSAFITSLYKLLLSCMNPRGDQGGPMFHIHEPHAHGPSMLISTGIILFLLS